MIKFLAEAHRGVQGFIFDGNTGKAVERASLKVKGRDVGFQTTKHGEFWRVLMPGLYKLEVCFLIVYYFEAKGIEEIQRFVDYNVSLPVTSK